MPFYGLAAVSKILSDSEVFALRKENEKLKKINAKLNWNLFWTKYNIEILTCQIQRSNFIFPEAPDCNCYCCGISGRLSPWQMDNEVHNTTCTFTPLLQNTFAYVGLKIVETLDIQSLHKSQHHLAHEYSSDFVDVDAHIVVEEDWTRFAYGSRFFNVTSMDDPAMLKLKNLFEILKTEPMLAKHD